MAAPSDKVPLLIPECHLGVGKCLADCWPASQSGGEQQCGERDMARTLVTDRGHSERIAHLAATAEI